MLFNSSNLYKKIKMCTKSKAGSPVILLLLLALAHSNIIC